MSISTSAMDRSSEKFTGPIGFIWFGCIWILLAGMAIVKYNTLHSSFLDLGIFLHNFSNISIDQWWQVFGGHAQPLMLAWGILYRSIPPEMAPVILLAAQAALLSWPLIFLYRIYGPIPALAFSLYFPLWYNALFDFHMDHMAVPLLFAFFFLVKKGRIWAAVSSALLLVLVKENFALQTVFCGLFLLGIRKNRLPGIILVAAGSAYFYVATKYLIPYVLPEGFQNPESSPYSWLGSNLMEIIWFVLSNPLAILTEIVSNNNKLLYLLYIFGALGFIPLLRPGIVLTAVPILALSLLSQVPNHSGFMHHYTAGLIAPFLIAFAEGLPVARRIWDRAALPKKWFALLLIAGLFLCHVLASPSPIGRKFWLPLSWHYNAKAYWITDRDIMIKDAMRSYISSDKKVAVSAQNTVNLGYLAHRDAYTVFPYGVIYPQLIFQWADRSLDGLWSFIKTGERIPIKIEEKWMDYLVIDLKRPWFVTDENCDWYLGKCRDEEAAAKFSSLLELASESYQTVFEEDAFFIMKRKLK